MDKKEILEDLRSKILTDQYPQGTPLIERDLCEVYGISRTPIREILWSLVTDGLVEQRSTRGFSVIKFEFNQIVDIFQTREAIEGMAARLACKRMDAESYDRLSTIRKELEQVDISSDSALGAELGRKMHHLIFEIAANSLLSDLHKKVGYLAALTTNMTKRNFKTELESQKYHLAIIDAILKGDEEESEKEMRDHLRTTCRNIISFLYPHIFMNM
jgi:DNA-binding GntR family transcriptional regulator